MLRVVAIVALGILQDEPSSNKAGPSTQKGAQLGQLKVWQGKEEWQRISRFLDTIWPRTIQSNRKTPTDVSGARAGSGRVIWKQTARRGSSRFFISQLMAREGFLLSWVGTDFCLVQGSLPKLTADCQLKKYFGLKKTLHHTYAGRGSPRRQRSLPRCQPGQARALRGDTSAQRVSVRGKRDRSSLNNRDIKLCETKGTWIILRAIVRQDINQTLTS